MLQRNSGKMGATLGKTSGWTHRLSLKHKQVKMINNVTYQRIDDEGLHIKVNDIPRCLAVDNVVMCAGQLSNNHLYEQLTSKHSNVHVIGGAFLAKELDAKEAIKQGAELAAIL